MNRPLSNEERHLIYWMLEHSTSGARNFLPQLEQIQVTPWKCPCGCASINLEIQGRPKPVGGIHPLADFVFGSNEDLSGIFVYKQSGILAGVEVYCLADNVPKQLPSAEALHPFSAAAQSP